MELGYFLTDRDAIGYLWAKMKELGYFLTDRDAIGYEQFKWEFIKDFLWISGIWRKRKNSTISWPIVMILGMYSSDGILLMIFNAVLEYDQK